MTCKLILVSLPSLKDTPGDDDNSRLAADSILWFVAEGILRLYCEAVGIDFQDCMINWKEVPQDLLKELEEWMEWMDTVLKAKGFLKKTPSKLPDLTDVPREVQQCVSDNIPFYEQLFAKRLKLH